MCLACPLPAGTRFAAHKHCCNLSAQSIQRGLVVVHVQGSWSAWSCLGVWCACQEGMMLGQPSRPVGFSWRCGRVVHSLGLLVSALAAAAGKQQQEGGGGQYRRKSTACQVGPIRAADRCGWELRTAADAGAERRWRSPPQELLQGRGPTTTGELTQTIKGSSLLQGRL